MKFVIILLSLAAAISAFTAAHCWYRSAQVKTPGSANLARIRLAGIRRINSIHVLGNCHPEPPCRPMGRPISGPKRCYCPGPIFRMNRLLLWRARRRIAQDIDARAVFLCTDLYRLAFLCVGNRTDASEPAATVPGRVGASHDCKLSTGSSFPAPPELRANRRRGSGVRAGNSAVSDFDGGRTASGVRGNSGSAGVGIS